MDLLPEWNSVSLVSIELWVSDEVDFVREVDVRIENTQSVVVVVAHLHVLENVMAEVRLDSRLERVGPVIQKSSSFNLK